MKNEHPYFKPSGGKVFTHHDINGERLISFWAWLGPALAITANSEKGRTTLSH